MLKCVLRILYILVGFGQIMAASAESVWPDPKDGDACYARLAAQTEFPVERMKAWNAHIHLLIKSPFTEARQEYSEALRNLCNAAFYFIEQGMGKVFEYGLEGNQARVRDMLAPSLLKIEKEEALIEQRLKTQAGVLMWMITAHPMKKE